jgi:HEAT repeat protein
LSDYLIKELKSSAPSEDTIKQQAILSRTLGLFHLPEIVLPALAQATQPQHDLEVRKNALGSIAVIAGRAQEEKKPLNLELIQPAVLEAVTDPAPLVRQLATFVLGLLPGDVSQQRLQVLLVDSDLSTRVNAAIGLARQDSTAGFEVFIHVLNEATANPAKAGSPDEFAQFSQVKNTLAALEKLQSKLSGPQRAELVKILEPMSQNYREPKLRIEAGLLRKSLSGQG